jgi:ribosomal protein L11 methyltransferase
MTNLYHLHVHPSYSLEQAWSILESAGIDILYGIEEEGETKIYAYLPSLDALSSFEWIIDCTPYTLPSIDWDAQWAAHAQHFHNGFVHIDFNSLGRNAPSIRLQPGSGFGDLSHPTTRLMIRMLAKHLQQQIVIDIGCGSGILTLAAVAMGASKAYGIDIDENAIEHSFQNACLNHLDKQCHFSTPSHFIWEPTLQPILILMNMIQSEQQLAWNSLPSLHPQPSECLTSGIRIEERERYLDLTTQWNWKLKEEQHEMGWCAFYFNMNGSDSNSSISTNNTLA